MSLIHEKVMSRLISYHNTQHLDLCLRQINNHWEKMEEHDSAASMVQAHSQDQEHPWPYLCEFFPLVPLIKIHTE